MLLASAPSARQEPSSRLSSAMSGSRELSSLLVRRLAAACFPPPPPDAPAPPDPPMEPPFPEPCVSLPFPPDEEEPGPLYTHLPPPPPPPPPPPSSRDRDGPPASRPSTPPPAVRPFLLLTIVSLGRTATSCWRKWPLPLPL